MDNFFLEPPSQPPTRFWKVKEHPSCPRLADLDLTPAHVRSLYLLVVKLMWVAGDLEPLDERGIRHIELARTIRVSTDVQFAPLGIYYCMSADSRTALILDVERIAGNGVVRMSRQGLKETFVAEIQLAIAKAQKKRG